MRHGRMRHGRTREAEEWSEVGSAKLSPVGEGFEAGVAGELGNDGKGEQLGERITFAARVATVGNGSKVGSESLKAEGERNIGGQRQGGQACGKVHRAPPERLTGG